MKKYLSLILALCLPALLGGCGAVPLPMPESPTPAPAADTEEITYEVSTDPYEQTVTAEDGTTLMVIDFQIPHLQAYANGTLIEDPSTPAQDILGDDDRPVEAAAEVGDHCDQQGRKQQGRPQLTQCGGKVRLYSRGNCCRICHDYPSLSLFCRMVSRTGVPSRPKVERIWFSR